VAQTKAELEVERWLLGERIKRNQALRQQLEMNCEDLRNVCDSIAAAEEAAREKMRKLKRLQIIEVPPPPLDLEPVA
jgi:hypothetical protein